MIKESAIGYIGLITHAQQAKKTLIMFYIWFVRYIVYYGIQFSLNTLGNLYFGLGFTALAETIAAILGGFECIE